MSRMLEEIRQQPETLERTLHGELRRIEKFRELVSRRKPRLIVLAAARHLRQRRAIRPLPH